MKELITKLRKSKIEINIVDGKLVLKSHSGAVPKDLLSEIKENKDALVEYIKSISLKGKFPPINKVEYKPYYSISSAQHRLYFLNALNKDSLVYNIPQVLRMTGELDRKRLSQAFHQLIERHESLRTSFEIVNDAPAQKIWEGLTPAIEFFEGEEEDRDAPDVIEKFIKPFDLSEAPLLRVGLLQTGRNEYLLLTDIHHIVTDGVSFGLLISDFMALYNREMLPPLPLQYKDYAEWQQGKEWQSLLDEKRSFWLKEFATPAIPLVLPTDFDRPAVKSYKGSKITFTTGIEASEKLRLLAAQEGATLFITLLSIYSILLGRLCNEEDIVIGIGSYGRPHADLENIIGMFANTLCLRIYPRGGLSFREYLKEVKIKMLSCTDNQDYQYENLVEELKVTRDRSRNPLFETMFDLRTFEIPALNIPGLTLKPYPVESQSSKVDLSLLAAEQDGALKFHFEYNTDLFKPETIQRFIAYFQKVVTSVIADPAISLEDIDFLSDGEKHHLLQVFNDTEVRYPEAESVIHLFENQVGKTPDQMAVVSDRDRISYDQLNNWANRIAGRIKSTLPESNQRIGVFFTPGAGMIAAMLAIMKAGCAYIPLSTNSSDERNKYILSHSDAKLLLCDQSIIDKHPAVTAAIGADHIIIVENNNDSLEACENITQKVSPQDLFYIIYTSGSTGRPKGVEVVNSGLLNSVQYYVDCCGIKEGMNIGQVANIAFDASGVEIWPCLITGACLHIASSATKADPNLMKTWLIENEIEVSFQPPVIAEHLIRMDWEFDKTPLKLMTIGGDRWSFPYHQKLPFRIFNFYGPTEDSIITTRSEINYKVEPASYSIGKPLANKSVYFLNKYSKLQPMGVPGELCIGGKGVARGYVNDEELTKEKFVDNPFVNGEKIYKTGDKGRWLEDGSIEFLGRMDNQVKIRGYRIEPGEIEGQISKHPKINEVVVLPLERAGEKHLVAYYTSTDKDMSASVLKEYLLGCLADYMVPSYFVPLDKFPATANGKINRNALPVPEIWLETNDRAPSVDPEKVPPSNDMQERLVSIWADVLKINAAKISIHSNFFESGGHSMNIIVLSRKINEEFGCHISVAEIFGLPTIASIETFLTRKDKPTTNSETSIAEAMEEANDNLKLLNDIMN